MSTRVPPWLVFLLTFVALHGLWEATRDTPLGRACVEGGLVPAAAGLVTAVHPAWQVRAQGRRLQSLRGSLTVQRGCEGMEFLAVGWAALLSAAWAGRVRHAGALVRGLLVLGAGVMTLSVLRLSTLTWIRLTHPDQLAAWHGWITPLLMVLGTALLCLPALRPAPR